jgi:hypothetical protein
VERKTLLDLRTGGYSCGSSKDLEGTTKWRFKKIAAALRHTYLVTYGANAPEQNDGGRS